MFSSIALDALLVIIFLMMIPLGFLRGGLREVCTSAGLLFAILLSEQWADRWGRNLSGPLDLSEGSAQFLVAVAIVVISSGVLGYGSSAAFFYQPGPGGRMYGAVIALLNGLVLVGFLINIVIDKVYGGQTPAVIQNAFVARAISTGFGAVLLFCAAGVIAATLFGMFVRERPENSRAFSSATSQTHFSTSRPAEDPAPNEREPEAPVINRLDTIEPHPAAPVRIREVRHWEEETRSQTPPAPHMGHSGGWRQTWPESKGQGAPLPWNDRPASKSPSSKRVSGSLRKSETEPSNPREVLREWMKDQDTDKGS